MDAPVPGSVDPDGFADARRRRKARRCLSADRSTRSVMAADTPAHLCRICSDIGPPTARASGLYIAIRRH